MSDIERRLRDLGERTRAEQTPSTLSARTIHRVKRRRLATIATSTVLVVALAFGGAVAAGAFDSAELVAPAEEATNRELLIEYHRSGGFAGEDIRLTVDVRGHATVRIAEAGAPTRFEHQLADSDLRGLESAIAAVDWPTVAGEHGFGPDVVADAIEYELRHEGYVVTGYYRAGPDEVTSLIGYLDSLLSDLTIDQHIPSCADRIDFLPTYLPERWLGRLQAGRGGGLEVPGALGHYGNDADAGTRRKALDGFADLLEGRSPFRQTSKERIEVLGAAASLGDIHEGFSVEFAYEGCALALVAYGIEREELARFAEGLRRRDARSESSSDPSDFRALWPEDTHSAAEEACESAAKEDESNDGEGDDVVSFRYDAESVILEFGYEVLGWDQATIFDRSGDGAFARNRNVYELRRGGPRGASPRPPAVIVDAGEVFPDCWSVFSVTRLPDREPTGVSVSVEGRHIRVGVDPLGATSLWIEVSYAGRKVSESGQVGDKGLGEFRLDFEPDTHGRALILFMDAEGEVFSVTSPSFPAGDFAAG